MPTTTSEVGWSSVFPGIVRIFAIYFVSVLHYNVRVIQTLSGCVDRAVRSPLHRDACQAVDSRTLRAAHQRSDPRRYPMGFSDWSDAAFQARQTHRHKTGQSAFTYDDFVRQSGVVRVHDQMNPFGVMRESRDSAQHPASLAIGVVFDVTGSMGLVPRVLQTKLGKLMRLLVDKGYVAHPQVLFGAVGDATCDVVPLQMGQFESGLEMDDDLGKIYLEGGGGGQVYETYELAAYFFACHTAIDCFEKRAKKGYFFTIGDEKPYPTVRREHVWEHIGDALKWDIPG